jgi:hypothetical protein
MQGASNRVVPPIAMISIPNTRVGLDVHENHNPEGWLEAGKRLIEGGMGWDNDRVSRAIA